MKLADRLLAVKLAWKVYQADPTPESARAVDAALGTCLPRQCPAQVPDSFAAFGDATLAPAPGPANTVMVANLLARYLEWPGCEIPGTIPTWCAQCKWAARVARAWARARGIPIAMKRCGTGMAVVGVKFVDPKEA